MPLFTTDARFMTGQDIASAQAFYHHPDEFNSPLSASFNFGFSNGATMTSSFVASGPAPDREPWFVFFVGGFLALYGYVRPLGLATAVPA